MLEHHLPKPQALVHPWPAHRHRPELYARQRLGAWRQAVLHRAVRSTDVRALVAAAGERHRGSAERSGTSRPLSRRVVEEDAHERRDLGTRSEGRRTGHWGHGMRMPGPSTLTIVEL